MVRRIALDKGMVLGDQSQDIHSQIGVANYLDHLCKGKIIGKFHRVIFLELLVGHIKSVILLGFLSAA